MSASCLYFQSLLPTIRLQTTKLDNTLVPDKMHIIMSFACFNQRHGSQPTVLCICVYVHKSWQPCRDMRQMCVSVITVIAPFTSSTLGGTAGQHHLDTYSTYMAIMSHGGVSWIVSRQTGEALKRLRVCCVSVFCDRVYVSVSLFPGDIFLSDFSSCIFFPSLSTFFHEFFCLL